MQATADNLAFAPPPEPAAFRGFVLAILAHLALMAALTWGINWQKDQAIAAVEAELWSAVPEEAAPKPEPVVAPPVVQAPPVVEKTPPPRPVVQDPDIAIEREKKRREEAERRRELEEQKKLEARRKQQQEEAAERKERAEAQAKLEKEKAKREADTKKRLAEEREKNIQRMLASAAGTGSRESPGAAARSKGPSATYAGRIAARIKPNIVFTETVTGNPTAEIVIRVAPDGTIVGAKPLKSSGVKSWDDAVLRAIEKTEKIPRDTDGTVVPEFTISFRPKD